MDKALVIPATFVVGSSFPANLPLADGSVKPIAECSRAEVAQAVEEMAAVVYASRQKLHKAYDEHVQDLEIFAQLSAYLQKYDQWSGVRDNGEVKQTIWSVDAVRSARSSEDTS
ncbi:MAG TPA: hypothetical protein VGC50_02430 [Gammaproteobacteria bacterium]